MLYSIRLFILFLGEDQDLARLLNITNLTVQVLHCNIQRLPLQHINAYPRQACFSVTCSESSCIIYPRFILYYITNIATVHKINQVSQGRNLFVTAVSSEYISHIANNTHSHLTLCQGQT